MIFGIDCSMRRIAVCCPEIEYVDGLKLPDKYDRFQSIQIIAGWCAAKIPAASEVFIEAPILAGARNIKSTLKAAMTTGGIIGALRHATIHLVDVASWKKEVVGHGGADKDAVADWLAASAPSLSKACGGDQDLIDATCIALFGYVGASSPVPAVRNSRVLRKPRGHANVNAGSAES